MVRSIASERVVNLKPCPFCGSTKLEVCNTWTASYWVECLGCSAQVHGRISFGERGTKALHVKAKASAIEAWNTRT